jgi:hypothetical protein
MNRRRPRPDGLSLSEVAMLITGSVMHVRWLLDVHTLRYLVRPDRIDVESVRALFRDDRTREPRERCLERLLADEIQAPTLVNPDTPYSLNHVLASLVQATWPPEQSL